MAQAQTASDLHALAAAEEKRVRRRAKAINDNRRDRLVDPDDRFLFPDEVAEANEGRETDTGAWLDRKIRTRELREQTERLSAALERRGIWSVKETDMATLDLTLGLPPEDIVQWRSVKFLPLVMQRDSAQAASSLRYFLAHHRLGRYARYAVVTSPDRVPALGPLREQMARNRRAISRWAHEADREWGVSVLYRGDELTRAADDRFETGFSYNAHCNVVFSPRRFMDEGRWTAFLDWSRQRLGGHAYAFHDGGRLKDVNEVVKYITKPNDLANASDDEVEWLFHQTYRANMQQPLGEFREFRKQLRDHAQVVRRVDPETGEVIEEQRRAPLKVGAVHKADGSIAYQIVHKRTRSRKDREDGLVEEVEQREEKPKHDDPQGARENLIVYVTPPTAAATPFKSTKVIVAGFTLRPTTFNGNDGLATLQRLQQEAQARWEANGAPPARRVPLHLEAWAVGTAATFPRRDAKAASLRALPADSLTDKDREFLAELAADRRRVDEARRISGALRRSYSLDTFRLSVQDWDDGVPDDAIPDDWRDVQEPPSPPPEASFVPVQSVEFVSSVHRSAKDRDAARAAAYEAWRASREAGASG